MLNHHPELNDTSALLILEAARAHAIAIGVPQNIVIVDASGRMLVCCRMQGAKFLSIETATAKAVTAASISAPTGNTPAEFGTMLSVTTQGKFTNLKGGLPVIINGQLAGAVGVGSGAPDEDIAVAQAGIDALMQALAKA